jgi:hypothetical protein
VARAVIQRARISAGEDVVDLAFADEAGLVLDETTRAELAIRADSPEGTSRRAGASDGHRNATGHRARLRDG